MIYIHPIGLFIMQMVMKYSFAKMLVRTDVLELKVQSYLQY